MKNQNIYNVIKPANPATYHVIPELFSTPVALNIQD